MCTKPVEKGGCFKGADQPVGSESPHPRPDPPLVTTRRKHKRQGAKVCHLMPNHHNMRFYMVLVKAGPETRLEVSDPHGIPAQGPGFLSRTLVSKAPPVSQQAGRVSAHQGPQE